MAEYFKDLLRYSQICFEWLLTEAFSRPEDKTDATQNHCRKLPLELSAILLICIKLPLVYKNVNLSSFEWLLNTGLTVILDQIQYVFTGIRQSLNTYLSMKYFNIVKVGKSSCDLYCWHLEMLK